MNILAIDTASQVASAAILNEDKLVCLNYLNHELKHSKKLLPTVESMLASSEMTYQDIDYFAVNVGPGSFTGLRIGLATVKGLAQVTNKPIIPVSTLYALSLNIPFISGLIVPVLDARRNQVYTSIFSSQKKNYPERLLEDSVISLDELISKLSSYSEPIYFLGDALHKFGQELTDKVKNGFLIPPYLRESRADSVAMAALLHTDTALPYYQVEPVYLRPSYAEEKK